MPLGEPEENSYVVIVSLGDVRKKDAVALAETIGDIIEHVFKDKIGNYAVSANHSKGFRFGRNR